ncbi:PDC sensor domain-containing protein [Ensifer soli]|uniref:PDC sensor domain-containing protein n=1 Tax=Ciceribacter sp. sgz301302 TaxID=3342379 RepID=UPI0035B8F0F1
MPGHLLKGLLLPLMLAGTSALPACANDAHVAPVGAYIETHVRPWIEDPLIVSTLKTLNLRNSYLTFPDIDELDARWRLEFTGRPKPLIDSIRNNPLSQFLAERQADANGFITEIIVMDARGLNAGVSEPTSDYWQGDEPKWQKTYLVGAGAVFIDEPQRDDSTNANQVQASLTITDPETGQPIGAITVGINLEAF